jgi:hypothetical protein
LSLLYALNSFLFVKSYLSIKAFVRSTFSELKSNSKKEQLAVSLYTDWYSMKNEADVSTSIACNVQKYFTRGLILTVITWCCLFFYQNRIEDNQNKTVTLLQSEFVIVSENKEFIHSELAKFYAQINTEPTKVFLISKKGSKDANKLFEFISYSVGRNINLEHIELDKTIINQNSVIIKLKR